MEINANHLRSVAGGWVGGWVGGASSDNSRSQSGGKIMVLGAILGGVVIAAAPALIKWATGQNPLA